MLRICPKTINKKYLQNQLVIQGQRVPKANVNEISKL
jgi:hypothetical protein